MKLQLGNITAIHGDCMDYMKTLPDKCFDLAIVDPPYGINASKMTMGSGKKNWQKSDWDKNTPDKSYFEELFRVSKNQIIWGGNYFTDNLHQSRCWISWNKVVPEGMSFSDFELAWTSFDKVCREVKCKYSGAVQNGNYQKKIHPTQKPIELYKWVLENYAKLGYRILDTHGGSFSHAIACHDLGFELTIIEKDEDYFDAAIKRLKWHQRQQTLQFT